MRVSGSSAGFGGGLTNPAEFCWVDVGEVEAETLVCVVGSGGGAGCDGCDCDCNLTDAVLTGEFGADVLIFNVPLIAFEVAEAEAEMASVDSLLFRFGPMLTATIFLLPVVMKLLEFPT